jgi:hypothetical protein
MTEIGGPRELVMWMWLTLFFQKASLASTISLKQKKLNSYMGLLVYASLIYVGPTQDN